MADEVVVVTGAGGGIGRALCQRLVGDGYRVHATDLRADPLHALQAELGPACSVQLVDLSAGVDYSELVQAATARGRLHGLVHAAAVLRRRPLDEITEADWDAQLDTNLKATFFLDRAVAQALIAQGQGGSIVNFASQGWWTGGFGGSIVYAASKGGVVSLSRGLARTLAPHNIRVNVVAPGFVDTPMMRSDMTEADLAASVAQVPLGRMAEPSEVADAASFLVGPRSGYMTGTTLNVSGGQLTY